MLSEARRHRPPSETTTMVLEASLGLVAVVSGALLVTRPDGSLLGMTTGDLIRGPFADFLIPGLVLGGVIGVGMLSASGSLLLRKPAAWRWTIALGLSLAVFEVVETFTVRFNPQQPICFALGTGLVVLGLRLRVLNRRGLRSRRADHH